MSEALSPPWATPDSLMQITMCIIRSCILRHNFCASSTRCRRKNYTFVTASENLLSPQPPFVGSEIMNNADHINTRFELTGRIASEPAKGVHALKPKGACWYCNQPLDNIRKFCSKTCADDYRTEEEVFNDL